jgi:hypothetical protein
MPAPRRLTLLLAPGLAAGLAGCAEGGGAEVTKGPFDPVYIGVESEVLDPTLFRFAAQMKGARAASDVETYARCAAAGYAVEKGFGFVRHVRTDVNERGGIWRADAVYTISPGLPRGLKTIDAEVTVADCAEQGIPTA